MGLLLVYSFNFIYLVLTKKTKKKKKERKGKKKEKEKGNAPVSLTANKLYTPANKTLTKNTSKFKFITQKINNSK